MKKYLILSLLTLCLLVPTTPAMAKANKQTVVFYVSLHCNACVQKIEKSIAFEKGVKDLVCDVKTQTVTVTYDANKTDVTTLQKAFEKIGKPATTTPPQPKRQCTHSCGQSCSSETHQQ